MKLNRLISYAIGILGGCASALAVMNPADFKEFFDDYLGTWEGEFEIKTSRGELLNKFGVRRAYWWEDQALKGNVVYIFEDGESESTYRIILSEWEPYTFVSDPSSPEAILFALKGDVARGTATWSKMLPKTSLPTQLNEKVVREEGEYIMKLWGDQEAVDPNGKPVLVRVEGALRRISLEAERPEPVPIVSKPEPKMDDGVVADGAEAIVLPEPDQIFAEPQPSAIPGVENLAEPMADAETPAVDTVPEALDASIDASHESTGEEKSTDESEAAQEVVVPASDSDTEVAAGIPPVETVPEADAADSTNSAVFESVPVEEGSVPESSIAVEVQPEVIAPKEDASVIQNAGDPAITSAIGELPILGIRETPRGPQILIDFYGLVRVGQGVPGLKDVTFDSMDEQQLHFKDGKGNLYSIARKDR
ncbi:MAG: hypothetical protein JW706_09715 [Opitutales bacterium]|nr:hypothetical protein [Opitutales bacterium]